MEKITTKSTSLHTATATDIVLRESKTTRLIFRPLLVDNEKEPAACVKGILVFEKKSRTEEWEPTEAINLNRLKVGEGVRLDLKSGETLKLYKELSDLYDLYSQYGTQSGQSTFAKVDSPLAKLASIPVDKLNDFLTADSELGGDLLSKLLSWATSEDDPTELINRLLELAPDSLRRLNTSANLQRLKNAITEWTKHKDSTDEELWQQLLSKNVHVLEQVFSWPVNVIEEKAYIGGKGIDNKGGGLVDFLVQNQLTNNVSLIEIKTPGTKLLRKEYRNGIFNISDDLSGGVMQVLNYKQTLLYHYQSLGLADLFESFDPKCVVVIGHASRELQSADQRKSFELYRGQLSDVTVITFDELVEKTRRLVGVLES